MSGRDSGLRLGTASDCRAGSNLLCDRNIEINIGDRCEMEVYEVPSLGVVGCPDRVVADTVRRESCEGLNCLGSASRYKK